MSSGTDATMICGSCGCAMQYIGKTNSQAGGYFCRCTTAAPVNLDTNSLMMENQRLEAKVQQLEAPKYCDWKQDEDGVYNADCGAAWVFECGGIKENGVKYCYKCGRLVKDTAR